MKKIRLKHFLTYITTAFFVSSSLIGCSANSNITDSQSDSSTQTESSSQAEIATQERSRTETQPETTNDTLDTETPITLTVYGPSIFSNSGETGAINAVTGETTLGYEVIVERFQELHPNVTLNIEPIGWTDWRAAIQAAVLGGGIDVICHGGLIPILCEPLQPYFDADPDFASSLYNIPAYNTDEMEGCLLNTPTVTSVPHTLSPGFMILDKQIFDHYGVAIPDESWTWDTVVSLAESLTGTDPVTGEQTYGFLMPQTGGTGMIKNHLLTASAYDAKVIEYGETAKESTVNFKTDAVRRDFQTIADLAKFCSPDNIEGVETALTIQENNQAAMSWTEGVVSTIQNINTLGLQDRFLIFPLPVIEEGEYAGNPSLYLGDGNFAISKDSEHKDWAWEFIKFMLTDEVAIEYTISNGGILNTAEGLSGIKEVVGDEYTELIMNVLEELPSDYNSTTNAYYDNVNFGAMGSYLSSELREMIKGNITVDQAIENTQKAVDDYFSTLE